MHHPEEEEDYDYESLGSNTTMLQNAFAGALAGIAEHCAMYPVDSIKVIGVRIAIQPVSDDIALDENASDIVKHQDCPTTASSDASKSMEGCEFSRFGSRTSTCLTFCHL